MYSAISDWWYDFICTVITVKCKRRNIARDCGQLQSIRATVENISAIENSNKHNVVSYDREQKVLELWNVEVKNKRCIYVIFIAPKGFQMLSFLSEKHFFLLQSCIHLYIYRVPFLVVNTAKRLTPPQSMAHSHSYIGPLGWNGSMLTNVSELQRLITNVETQYCM